MPEGCFVYAVSGRQRQIRFYLIKIAAFYKLQFVEGRDFNEVETYLPLAAAYGVDEATFRHKFTSDDYKLKAQQEFELVQSWGITGFPAVVCQSRDKLYLAARGFTPYEQLTATIEQILAGEIAG